MTNEAHGLKVLSDNSLLVSGFAPIVVSSTNGGPVVASEPLDGRGSLQVERHARRDVRHRWARFSFLATTSAEGLAVQANGRIVLVGTIETVPFPATKKELRAHATARERDDRRFVRQRRQVRTAFTDRGDEGFGVALQSDGKIVAAGASNTPDQLELRGGTLRSETAASTRASARAAS